MKRGRRKEEEESDVGERKKENNYEWKIGIDVAFFWKKKTTFGLFINLPCVVYSNKNGREWEGFK